MGGRFCLPLRLLLTARLSWYVCMFSGLPIVRCPLSVGLGLLLISSWSPYFSEFLPLDLSVLFNCCLCLGHFSKSVWQLVCPRSCLSLLLYCFGLVSLYLCRPISFSLSLSLSLKLSHSVSPSAYRVYDQRISHIAYVYALPRGRIKIWRVAIN